MMVDRTGQLDQAGGAAPSVLARMAAARPAANALSLPAQLTARKAEARQMSADLDHRLVVRSYRKWIDWIEADGSRPIAIAVVLGERLTGPQIVEAVSAAGFADAPVVELAVGYAADPAPLWPTIDHSFNQDEANLALRLVLIQSVAATAANPQIVNRIRRECVMAVAEAEMCDAENIDFLDGLPAGTFVLSQGKEEVALTDARRRRFSLRTEAADDLSKLVTRILSERAYQSVRMVTEASRLVALAEAVGRETSRLAEPPSVKPDRVASVSGDLPYRLAQLTAAKSELAKAVKKCASDSSALRQAIDGNRIVDGADQGQFEWFLAEFRPEGQSDLSGLTAREEKAAWWNDTWVSRLSFFFNRKARYSLKSSGHAATLPVLLDPYREKVLNWVGIEIPKASAELQSAVEAIESVFGGLEEATRPVWPIRISRRQMSGQKELGDGEAEESPAAAYRKAVDNVFEAFATREQHTFFVDIEEKGFIGQIGEARSGVFGFFFLLLFFARPATQPSPNHNASQSPAEEVCTSAFDGLHCFTEAFPARMIDILTWGMAVGTLIAFAVNRAMRERKLRISISERFQSRVDEMRNRIPDVAKKAVEDVLGRFERSIADYGELVEENLNRLIAEVQAQIAELGIGNPRAGQLSVAGSGRQPSIGSQRPSGAVMKADLLDDCRKLEAQLFEAHVATVCQKSEA